MKLLRTTVVATIFMLLLAANAYASKTNGTIDPRNAGNYFASFVHAPGSTGSEVINFGKFTTQSAYNISITDNGLRGFAWGAEAGWIVMNCLDIISGCTTGNENFKVAVSSTGVLSGYAWGQKTGWINFGPFTNNNTPQVQIGRDGVFKGTTGDAGYAWSQRYGWITFDCTDGACVTTDFVPASYRGGVIGVSVAGGTIGGVPQGTGTTEYSQCSDGIDNDRDGLIDHQNDPGCYGIADNTENTVVTPTVPIVPSTPGVTPPISPIPSGSTEPSTSPAGNVFPGNGAQSPSTAIPQAFPETISDQPTTTQSFKEFIAALIKKWGLIIISAILLVIFFVRRYIIKS